VSSREFGEDIDVVTPATELTPLETQSSSSSTVQPSPKPAQSSSDAAGAWPLPSQGPTSEFASASAVPSRPFRQRPPIPLFQPPQTTPVALSPTPPLSTRTTETVPPAPLARASTPHAISPSPAAPPAAPTPSADAAAQAWLFYSPLPARSKDKTKRKSNFLTRPAGHWSAVVGDRMDGKGGRNENTGS
jgi:hypothetical protein